MLFNSFRFLIFYPVVLFLYFLTPYKYKWFLLLLSSYYFYMCWRPGYLLLILFTTIITYYSGILMAGTENRKYRKYYLMICMLVNFGVLFIFKYFNFFNNTMDKIFGIFGMDYSISNLSLLLPVGISFYTFQTISYIIDVYKGNKTPEKHFGIFALYVSFFPQLVAGPIERSERLMPQFYINNRFNYERFFDGLKLMLLGFFKKVVIADKLAILVNSIYNNPTDYQGIPLITATVFFAFQIYCDFSGYSDIAIGSANIMGFKLMQNFNNPYLADSIGDFWRRWHISLSSWFRDYVYIPLGGNRVKPGKHIFNIFITFLLSGLWHGANYTFVIWGAIHGAYLIIETLTKEIFKNIIGSNNSAFLGISKKILVFCLVCFAWIFFRANNLIDAMYIIKNLFAGVFSIPSLIAGCKITVLILGVFDFVMSIFLVMCLIIYELLNEKNILLSSMPVGLRWAVYYFVMILILVIGEFGENEFIYFQF